MRTAFIATTGGTDQKKQRQNWPQSPHPRNPNGGQMEDRPKCIECGLPMYQRASGVLCCDNPYCTCVIKSLAGKICNGCEGTGKNKNISVLGIAVIQARGHDKYGKTKCNKCNGTGRTDAKA